MNLFKLHQLNMTLHQSNSRLPFYVTHEPLQPTDPP